MAIDGGGTCVLVAVVEGKGNQVILITISAKILNTVWLRSRQLY